MRRRRGDTRGGRLLVSRQPRPRCDGVQRGGPPARCQPAAPRRARDDRRGARRARVAARGDADGLLEVRPGGRRPLRRAHRDPACGTRRRPSYFGVRAQAAAGAVRATLADRRSSRSRRSGHVLPGHVQRQPAGLRVRGEPARRAGRRRAGRGHAAGVERLRRARGRARVAGSQPGLRVPVARPGHRRRLHDRDPHPVQEPALPGRRPAGLGPPRDAHPRRGRPGGQLGAGTA